MNKNKEKEIQFLPFHAINEFMTDEFRREVIELALQSLPQADGNIAASLNKAIKKLVKVPGFRNSLKAPLSLKIRPFSRAFEKSPQMVASTLAVWAAAHPDLRHEVFEMLNSRGWELLPLDADRTRLPGFLIVWPSGEKFEALYEAYQNAYPDSDASQNDVSLMVVWLSGRLPYKFSGEEDPPVGEDDPTGE